MNRKNLYDAMTEIDPALIEDAAPDTSTKGKTLRLRLVAVAAAVLLLTAVVMIPLGVMHRGNTPPPIAQTSEPSSDQVSENRSAATSDTSSAPVSESPSEPVNESPESPSEEIVYDEDTFRPYYGQITFSEDSVVKIDNEIRLHQSSPQSTPATPREHQEVMIIDLFKTHLEGSYQGSYKTGAGELIDFYKTKDEIYFSVSHESGRLVSYSNETSIQPNLNRDLTGIVFTVEEIYAEIDKLVAKSVPDLAAYTLTLERETQLTDDHGGYRGFSLVTKEYRKVIGGVQTNDRIWITMTTLGEVTEFVAQDIGYYDGIEVVNFNLANYDEEIIECCKSSDSYARNKQNAIWEYEIRKQYLSIINGEYKLVLSICSSVEWTVDGESETHHGGSLFDLSITPDSVVITD